MNNDIYVYDKNNQLNNVEIQQLFDILSELQKAGQIKKYVNDIEECRIKFGNLGEQKSIFILKLDNLIVSFVSLSSNSLISFIGTRLGYQRKGFAKKIINNLKLRYNPISANLDSLFPKGIEGLLGSCGFEKTKGGNIWKWEK